MSRRRPYGQPRGFGSALMVAIAAICSMFIVSVIWITTKGPFETVADMLTTSMNSTPGMSVAAVTGMNYLNSMFKVALSIFIVITLLVLLAWWYMKTQEREIATEAYYY